MYALVADVESYPEFLPWCAGATLHSRTAEAAEASLELQRGGVSKTFRTRNSLSPGKAMGMALVGGPFRHLDGGWSFEQLGDEGCKVTLQLDFEFENPLVDGLFGRYFEDTTNALVESFTQRAAQVYADS